MRETDAFFEEMFAPPDEEVAWQKHGSPEYDRKSFGAGFRAMAHYAANALEAARRHAETLTGRFSRLRKPQSPTLATGYEVRQVTVAIAIPAKGTPAYDEFMQRAREACAVNGGDPNHPMWGEYAAIAEALLGGGGVLPNFGLELLEFGVTQPPAPEA